VTEVVPPSTPPVLTPRLARLLLTILRDVERLSASAQAGDDGEAA